MSAGVSDNNQRPVFAFKRAFGTRRSTSGRRPEQSLPLPGVDGRYGFLTGHRTLAWLSWARLTHVMIDNAPQSATAHAQQSAGRHDRHGRRQDHRVKASNSRVKRQTSSA